jgi:hypothetical protein
VSENAKISDEFAVVHHKSSNEKFILRNVYVEVHGKAP